MEEGVSTRLRGGRPQNCNYLLGVVFVGHLGGLWWTLSRHWGKLNILFKMCCARVLESSNKAGGNILVILQSSSLEGFSAWVNRRHYDQGVPSCAISSPLAAVQVILFKVCRESFCLLDCYEIIDWCWIQ